jgi:UPF0716 protein FxsA
MGRILFVLFTVVPLVELYLLVLLGRHMGPWTSVGLVLVTAVLGAALAKREGWRVLRRWQESLARGEMPEEGLLGGVLVLVGGVLLVTPGVLTDLAGVVLLLPPTRRLVAARVRRWLERRMATGNMRVTSFYTGPAPEGTWVEQQPGPYNQRSQPQSTPRQLAEEDAEFSEDKPGRG